MANIASNIAIVYISKGILRMKKLRVFKCKCGQRIERLVKDNVRVVTCDCGKDASRTLSAPRCFGNTTGSSPSVRY